MFSDFTTTSDAVSSSRPEQQAIRQPRRGWQVPASLIRFSLLPALLMPVLWGAALAWWQASAFDGLLLGFLLAISGMLGIGLNLLDQYQDYRRASRLEAVGPHPHERILGQAPPGEGRRIVDGYHCLRAGMVRPGAARSLAYIALMIALFSVLWLGLLGGWPLWFFGGSQMLLILLFTVPAIRYGGRWWIVDDIGLLLALGILPTLSTFYAFTGTLSQTVLVAALTPGVLTWLAFEAHHLSSWRRDWKLRKRTAVAVLGPHRALDVATFFGLLAFAATILLVALDEMPVWSLLVLGALPTFLHAFARGHRQTFARTEARQVIARSTLAAILAGLLLIGSLWIGP